MINALNRKGSVFVLLTVGALILITAGVILYWYNKTESAPTNDNNTSYNTASPEQSFQPSTEVANLQTYVDEKGGISFQYPNYLSDVIRSKGTAVEVVTKQSLVEKYKGYGEGGCPANCGRLAQDPNFLQQQFDILSELDNQPSCVLSDLYKEQIEKNFVLFTGGIPGKLDVSGLTFPNGKCALRLIESDGFDVSLTNFYYKVSFMDGDKIIFVQFKLFPEAKGFKAVEDLWHSFGWADGICGTDCYDKEVAYFQKVTMNNPVVTEVTEAYDKIMRSIRY